MYPKVQNIDDRTLVLGVTKDLVGVNGIDPARQGIDPIRNGVNPFYQVYQGMEERSIGVSTGHHGWHKMYQLNPWQTGRMPFAPTGFSVIDRNENRTQCVPTTNNHTT